jgi:hypothetical protein
MICCRRRYLLKFQSDLGETKQEKQPEFFLMQWQQSQRDGQGRSKCCGAAKKMLETEINIFGRCWRRYLLKFQSDLGETKRDAQPEFFLTQWQQSQSDGQGRSKCCGAAKEMWEKVEFLVIAVALEPPGRLHWGGYQMTRNLIC